MINRLTPLMALFIGVPALLTAQSGVVQYDQATRLDFNMPANSPWASRMPKNTVKQMKLTFTPEATLFGPGVQRPDDRGGFRGGFDAIEIRSVGGGEFRGGDMAMMRGGMAFFGGASSNDITGAYTNLGDGSYTEVREFLGRTFRIPSERPSFAWKLTGEQASFLGHPVFQAIAQQDSSKIEAWFTPDIPVSAGPAQYGGLPGLILTLAVDSNRVVYTATAVDTKTAVEPLKAPKEGSKVTREEYDRIVKEKTAEMEKQRGGRRN